MWTVWSVASVYYFTVLHKLKVDLKEHNSEDIPVSESGLKKIIFRENGSTPITKWKDGKPVGKCKRDDKKVL